MSAVTAQAAPTVTPKGPPYSYAACLKATAKKWKSPSHRKWRCDRLVKKGLVKPPKR
ncbi:hypothetical protein [Streptomyces iconiensis]|uniref:Uncharacterized protein n=1 Tax=Streptomyces iconiensis TaxID=1384038 RepID=A0ABT6ZW97_9ACTN|nr:hypothetical protein [Streptomyces iconiensis]MDJ1132896.1 hypothetical protein [Streptomyces iconiensis]